MASYYVRAAQRDSKGNLQVTLGTLSACIIDGRLSRTNAIAAAREAIRKRHLGEYQGFYIRRADSFPEYSPSDFAY